MICENSYYPDDSNTCKPLCKNSEKMKNDHIFHDKCPLIYYCTISKRFEQTADMFGCPYRKDDADGKSKT